MGKDAINFLMPLDFIRGYESLSWGEALWGCRNGLISHQALIDLACHQIEKDAAPEQALVDLCWLSPEQSHDVEALAQSLANNEATKDAQTTERKWLNLSLAWAIQTWDQIPNPPGTLEYILAQFGYPDEFEKINRVVAGMAGAQRPPGPERDRSDAAFLELLKQHFISHGIPLPARH